jgi:NADH-quinone oxidoreductase subunit G
MPELFIDGRPLQAENGQTVIEVARAHGIDIPHFCWHPALSVSGSCRLCMVEVEGRGLDIACNLPVADGMRVSTMSPDVQRRRREMIELTLLNHPVDCGICDKAGECTLQDYHYEHNGRPSTSIDAKVHATKFHALSPRIVLDNERCVLCSRCVRFTREVSGSHGLGIVQRGDASLVRATEDGAFDRDAYSDNVIDLCPVGALLSRATLYQARVWYLQPTRSVCPGCERGCAVDLWHRKPEWRLRELDARQNRAIVRVTPAGSPDDGRWICNKGRDLPAYFGRRRALHASVDGEPAPLASALAAARDIVSASRRIVVLVSSFASNEELDALESALGERIEAYVKRDHRPVPGEIVQDDLLIRPDKNPNRTGALARFPAFDETVRVDASADTLIVWGEGFDTSTVAPGTRLIVLGAFESDRPLRAGVFIPISLQTERDGHYTNFEGRVGAFSACFDKPAGVAHASEVFAAIAERIGVAA